MIYLILKERWFMIGIAILLIALSVILFNYRFQVELFANENFRIYFISCDERYLPVGPHGAVLAKPPCIRDWFTPPYLSDAILIIILMGGGVALIIYKLIYKTPEM